MRFALKREHLTQFLEMQLNDRHLTLEDSYFDNKPIDLEMSLLFGSSPKTHKDVATLPNAEKSFDASNISISDAINRLLALPTIASKKFLITIADRSVTGLIARDQMIGPWQVPVADCAISLSDFTRLSRGGNVYW